MHGYERDEYEDLDEYEEEGEEQEEDEEGEEEYEEEEPQQPPQELLEYLELRQRLKEDIRKQRKKELGSVNGRSTEIKKALPRDNYGSFFGPSQPVIAQRVIQESKSLLENPNLAAKVLKSNHANDRSSASKPAVSKSGISSHAPKVTNGLKTKVQMLKNTRDYSFLLSDDAELPAPSKGSVPHKDSALYSDARLSLPPSSKQSLSNTRRKLLNDHEVRKPIPGSSQMQSKLLTQKSVSVSKQSQLALDLRKQLSSSKGSGPDRPLGPKVVPPKVIGVPNGKRVLTPGVKSTVPALHKPTPSKLQPSIPRQSLVQKKELLQSGKSKGISNQAGPSSKSKRMMQKQAVPSSKSQIKQMPPKTATRSLEDRRPARKPMRHDEEGDGAEAISMIRRMFGYNPNRYQDDDDTSDMEANFDDILREEKRSAKIARKEDEEELRKIEEEERREQLRKQAKKRKLSHH
ncbi:protein spt2-like isoform X2 [Nicotiana tomentosiformis]|uniref:protein spt2-like isoform X2 n=1 Tax=Nicotiana tomentosiformis TaxID=4098 RepID=UPI0008791A46|nr:protein spt2-like isoform X2 [Nicotiana tomentosiformis]XP_033508439.1 protein spt2-like isoform X2 [Nicotiana tomentosiformis]